MHLSVASAEHSEAPVNPAVVYLASVSSDNSRRCIASRLNIIAKMVGASDLTQCRWETLRPEHVLMIMRKLEQPDEAGHVHGPSTVNCFLSALKGVAKTAWLSGLIDNEIYLRIKAVKQRRYHRLPAGRCLSFRESRELISQCGSSSIQDSRDRAILLLMLGSENLGLVGV